MKKRRLIVVISIMLIVCLAFSLSSCLFELKTVDIGFVDSCGNKIDNNQTLHFATKSKVEEIKSSTSFDYGKLLFLISKQKYRNELETKNPYLEVINIQAIFPNSILVNVRERLPVFFMRHNDSVYIFDRDFKLLEVSQNIEISNLIEVKFLSKNNTFMSYFDFFEISNLAYDCGQFLGENNLVFKNISNICYIFSSFDNNLLNCVKDFVISENSNFADLSINTCSPYGIQLKVENVLENFDKKMTKLLNAFFTLVKNEKIKTTYGILKIDKNLNCFWNNL